MHNASMYCLCLHDKTLPIVKKLGYLPVGLGSENFSKDPYGFGHKLLYTDIKDSILYNKYFMPLSSSISSGR